MLELTHYSIQKIENLKDFFLGCYVVVGNICHYVIPNYIRFRRNYTTSHILLSIVC